MFDYAQMYHLEFRTYIKTDFFTDESCSEEKS